MSTLGLDDHQTFILMKFRRAVADVRQPHHDDKFLLRWLKARSWNVDAAEKMLRQSLKWRDQWEVDTLNTWQPPEVMIKYRPCGTSGFDKTGCPVIILPFANLDIVGFIHSMSTKDIIKTVVQFLEENLKWAAENGENRVIGIFDLENCNMTQFLSRPAISLIVKLLQIYEANYPETLKTCFIINAPALFAVAYNITKKILNEETLKKIAIFKNDPEKWTPAILEIVDPDNLPKHYGGNLVDPDGNPKYTTKIQQGAKVPKCYYKENLNSDNTDKYTTVVINKGDKLTLDFQVDEEGSLLRWDFYTKNNDIGFGIKCHNADGSNTSPVPQKRTEAHLMVESGVLECTAPGKYSVTFDNSYSLLMSKTVHYNVYVMPPVIPNATINEDVATKL